MTLQLQTQSTGYRIGWWVLVVITGASILNHLTGPLAGFAEGDMEVLAFFALAAMNIYALVVLLTGYRRGEPWGLVGHLGVGRHLWHHDSLRS